MTVRDNFFNDDATLPGAGTASVNPHPSPKETT